MLQGFQAPVCSTRLCRQRRARIEPWWYAHLSLRVHSEHSDNHTCSRMRGGSLSTVSWPITKTGVSPPRVVDEAAWRTKSVCVVDCVIMWMYHRSGDPHLTLMERSIKISST